MGFLLNRATGFGVTPVRYVESSRIGSTAIQGANYVPKSRARPFP
jgi:hypothetical protein